MSCRTSSYFSSIDKVHYPPLDQAFNPLNQLVLPHQQLLQLAARVATPGLLQTVDFALERGALPFVPQPLENHRALAGVMDVGLTFAGYSSYELGLSCV